MNARGRAQVLAQARVFSQIPRAELAVLAEMMQPESFPKGSTVCEIGEPADRVYVVASGTLSVFLKNGTTPARHLRAGDVLGEYGMVAASARTATVKVADEDAVLLALDYERFRAYLVRFPEALWVLFEGAAKRLFEAERR
ncbi:MAG: cyclic nucleotide-binding domain-containing protein [Labilithrix sp.]